MSNGLPEQNDHMRQDQKLSDNEVMKSKGVEVGGCDCFSVRYASFSPGFS